MYYICLNQCSEDVSGWITHTQAASRRRGMCPQKLVKNHGVSLLLVVLGLGFSRHFFFSPGGHICFRDVNSCCGLLPNCACAIECIFVILLYPNFWMHLPMFIVNSQRSFSFLHNCFLILLIKRCNELSKSWPKSWCRFKFLFSGYCWICFQMLWAFYLLREYLKFISYSSVKLFSTVKIWQHKTMVLLQFILWTNVSCLCTVGRTGLDVLRFAFDLLSNVQSENCPCSICFFSS